MSARKRLCTRQELDLSVDSWTVVFSYLPNYKQHHPQWKMTTLTKNSQQSVVRQYGYHLRVNCLTERLFTWLNEIEWSNRRIYSVYFGKPFRELLLLQDNNQVGENEQYKWRLVACSIVVSKPPILRYDHLCHRLQVIKNHIGDPRTRQCLIPENKQLLDELCKNIDTTLQDPNFRHWCEVDSQHDPRCEKYLKEIGHSFIYVNLRLFAISHIYVNTHILCNLYKPAFGAGYVMSDIFYSYCENRFNIVCAR